MEPQYLGQPQLRAGKGYPMGAQPNGAAGAAGNFRFSRPLDQRAVLLPANDPAEAPRTSAYCVTGHDLHSPLQLAADILAVVALGVLTGIAYQEIFFRTTGPVWNFACTGLVVALLFSAVCRLICRQHAVTTTNGFDRLRDTAMAWSLTFATLILFLFSLKVSSDFSRGAIFSFYLIGLPIVGAWRVLAPPHLVRLARKAGWEARECIVIGDIGDPTVEEFAGELNANSSSVPTVMKFRAHCENQVWSQEHNQLIARIIGAARALKHGEIYLCAAGVTAERLADIQRALSILPRAIYIVPDAATAALVRCKPSPVGSRLAVEVRREPLNRVQHAVKRGGDIVVAALAIVGLMPLWLLIAAAIKLDSHGPVFFLQTRNGYRGKPFKIVKFRTMHVQEDGPVVRQASRNDARVTRIGRLLRQSSIDELPQLLNVLIGQMSLVGPRPHARAHDELYAKAIENYEIRQHVKPGITGWAQVHGLRGETAALDQMYRRIEYDLWYAVNASLLLDAEILVRTIFEVFRRRNAY